jgi:DNA-binding LytR/AlgR family response regulator
MVFYWFRARLRRIEGVLEENLGSAFYRIHKSFLHNVSQILEYSKEGGSFIVLKNGKKLTVSHRRKDKFAKEFSSINFK